MNARIPARAAFVLRMAWRDSRGSRRRLLLYSSSIVLGIAALVAVGSLGANLREAMRTAAKGLVGADLAVTSPAPFDAATEARLAGLGGEEARERLFASMMAFPGAGGALRLVQVRAISGNFPFYGEFQTDPAPGAARIRGGGPVVVLEDALMRQFGVRAGDSVRLGRELFTVVGALRQMPGEEAGASMLAPRAVIPMDALAATGLGGGEALMRYRLLIRLPAGADADAVAGELRRGRGGARLSFETAEGRRRELGRAFEEIDDFLCLVGFIALFLGGIGVASALHAYVGGKGPSVAVLRCLGAGAGDALAIYLVQALALGMAGSLLGAALGVAVQQGVPRLVGGLLPFRLESPLAWGVVGRGMGAGIGICLLFAALPILRVRRIPPLAALRPSEAAGPAGRPDWVRLALGFVLVAAAAGFAVLQTGSAALGIGYAAALFSVMAVLAGLSRLTVLGARRLVPDSMPYPLRQGLSNLHRPGNRTTLLLVATGLGTFLILTLVFARSALLADIRGLDAGGRPNLIFFDIQEDQVGTLEKSVAAAGGRVTACAPLVTMRIASIRGRAADELARDRSVRLPGWALRREYRSTYRPGLSASETLVAGTLAGRVRPSDAGIVPVSVEEGLARDLRLGLGDEIDWDVQGVTVRTRVGSLRAVEWRRMEPNFFVVFPPGVLDDAPKTFIAAVRAEGPAGSARVQGAVAGALPTVTAIDLAVLEETLDGILGKAAFAVELVAAATALTGMIVLASAVLAGGRQRGRETALLKALGASRRQALLILAAEHAALGLAGAGAGGCLAVAASALLARLVLKLPAHAPPAQLAAAVAAAALLATAAGVLGGWRSAAAPPLEALRQEE